MLIELPINQDQWDWLGDTISRHSNAKLAPELIKLIFPWVRLIEYKAKNSIIVEDEIGETMYLIYEGRVSVVCKKKKIAELGAGDFFGEMSLVLKAPRTATVNALTKCQVFELSWRAVSTITEYFPELTQALQMSTRVRMEELLQKLHVKRS